jgi:hypothetical protein
VAAYCVGALRRAQDDVAGLRMEEPTADGGGDLFRVFKVFRMFKVFKMFKVFEAPNLFEP